MDEQHEFTDGGSTYTYPLLYEQFILNALENGCVDTIHTDAVKAIDSVYHDLDYSNDDRIIRMPDIDHKPDPRGLGYVLFSCMQKYKENVAQIDGITGQKDTYKSLLQRCTRTAIKMRAMGITNDDIVTTCTFNHLNSCVPYIAALFLGAKISALDATLSVQDTAHLLRQVTPKIVFVRPESVSLIEDALAELKKGIKIVVFGSSDKYQSFDEFLKPSPDEDDFKPFEVKSLRETVIIFFSSGTTGLPKGICVHHYGVLCQLKNTLDFKFNEDIYFSFSSLYWVTMSSVLCSTILGGKSRMVIPRFDADVIWNAIHKFRPTCMVAVPFHYASLYQAKPAYVDTSSLKHVEVGGGALIESQILAIQEMFPSSQIFTGYGQTEMAVMLTIFKPSSPRDCELKKSRPTSCGTGIPGIWYKVVDIETEELLGPNQQGELRLKTEFALNGLYNMDSSDLWDEDGWYKTGDLVYYDEEKCFYVVDRLKEFLKYQSWHVAPALLESILISHPDILTALIIGIPHEIDENHLMALVVLKNKNSSITPAEIKKYVDERVDDRKRLRGGVKIVDSIPLPATGKMKRREIRDMVLRGEL